jgi:hypothetical protein
LSIAYITFSATYVDTQGSAPDAGAMWVAVRQDGAVMIATADSMPPEKFGTGVWKPVIDGAFNSFANPGT